MVLGHERCGAETAAINHAFSEGKLNSLITYIDPAVRAAQSMEGNVVSNTFNAYVHLKG